MVILADKRIIIEDISEQLGISVGTDHSIVQDDLFLRSVVIGFHLDNASPHMAARTVETVRLVREHLPYCYILLYNPGLLSSNFLLFGLIKEFLHKTKFSSDADEKNTASKWLRTQSKDFYAEEIQKLVFQWKKYALKNGDHIFSWET